MNGHTGGLGVRGRDRLGEDVVGPQRSQVAVRAEVAVDPVAHDLDPPVALARLAAHGLGELGDVVELEPVVAQVALGPGEVAARAHEARQVTTAVHPPRVERRAGVAHQENPAVAVRQRLLLRGRRVDGALGAQPDVAVHVDEAGQGPALELDHVGALRRRPGEADPPVLTHRSPTSRSSPTMTWPRTCSVGLPARTCGSWVRTDGTGDGPVGARCGTGRCHGHNLAPGRLRVAPGRGRLSGTAAAQRPPSSFSKPGGSCRSSGVADGGASVGPTPNAEPDGAADR